MLLLSSCIALKKNTVSGFKKFERDYLLSANTPQARVQSPHPVHFSMSITGAP